MKLRRFKRSKSAKRLAGQVLEQITLHPETHRQNIIENACGTQRCIAGWAVFLAPSYRLEWDATAVRPDGSTEHALTVARELLELSPARANDLFMDFDNVSALKKLEKLT